MFICIDEADGYRIVAIASNAENLATHRTPTTQDLEIDRPKDSIQIGDWWVDGRVVWNLEKRKAEDIKGYELDIIENSLREKEALSKGFEDWRLEFKAEKDAAIAERAKLES